MKNKKIIIIAIVIICVCFIPYINDKISFQSARTKIISNLNAKYNEEFSITDLTQEQLVFFKGNYKAQVKSTNNPDLIINVEYRPLAQDESNRYSDDYQSQLASKTLTKYNKEKFANILKDYNSPFLDSKVEVYIDSYPKKIDTNNIAEIIKAAKGTSDENTVGRIFFYGFVVINTKKDEEQIKSLFENDLDYFKYASKTASYSVAIVDKEGGSDPDYDDLIKNYLNSDLNGAPSSCLVAGMYKTDFQTINTVDSLSKTYTEECG